jgi:pyruvate/2-oxoglutarate dehydrogenase complex dihydrolipoamide acyltransferase (E2) component
MPRQFILPDLGEGITEAQIVRVLIKPGEPVKQDQPLMEVETDKAAVEIPSPYAGVAKDVHVKEGQTVNVGSVIVTFDDGDGAVGAKSQPAAAHPPAARASAPPAAQGAPPVGPTRSPVPAPPARPSAETPVPGKTVAPAAPAVRKLARELNVDIDAIAGSGPGGRVTKEDVEAAAGAKSAAPGRAAAPPPSRTTLGAAAPGVADTDKWGSVRKEPINQIRKTIANQMSRSAFTAVHVTHCDEADITELDRLRRELNDATGNDPKLTVMTFMVRATCNALRKYPIFNSSFDLENGFIIYKDYINIGVAVDTERGLIVPVIRNSDQLSMRGIAAALRSIADRVRTNQFAIEDLRGGTFTITNVGALGGTFSTPIINYPEVAILGLGRSKKVPVYRNGSVAEALILPLNVSFDHRATDGANAARFTREIISYLETPAKFLLD